MAYATEGKFSLDVADTSTMKEFRLVRVNSSGQAAYATATTDDEVLAVVGVTDGQCTEAGDITVRGFDGGVHKIAVAASQTVAAGNDLYITGTTGCVITGSSGWLVGTALTGATSGASELAIISAVMHKPMSIAAGT